MSRLDIFLTNEKRYASRARAQRAIREGLVSVNGIVIKKASYEVAPGAFVESAPDPVPFVSRGALKLQGALAFYHLEVEGKKCLDVGASTGGFTQVLLDSGAAAVTAVDVGHDQLNLVLREDPRVTSLEGMDIRCLPLCQYKNQFDLVSIDVSFISLRCVLPAVFCYMKPAAACVALVKPQFELGSAALNKKGIVKEPRLLPKAVARVRAFAEECGFAVEGIQESPIKGGDGNTEFLMLLTKIG